jgi:hypothetical protein
LQLRCGVDENQSQPNQQEQAQQLEWFTAVIVEHKTPRPMSSAQRAAPNYTSIGPHHVRSLQLFRIANS